MDCISQNERRFNTEILRRGKEYYLSGKVEIRQKMDLSYFATVHGHENYHVHISLGPTGRIVSSSCSCPYFDSGRHCKHEAALLYAIQADFDESEKALTLEEKAAHTSDPLRDFCSDLTTRHSLSLKGYLAYGDELLKAYGPKMSPEEVRQAKKEIIANSHLYGAYYGGKQLGEYAFSLIKEEPKETQFEFTESIYAALPNFDAKGYLIRFLLLDPSLSSFVSAMAIAHCFPGREFDSFYLQKDPPDLFASFTLDALTETARYSSLGPLTRDHFLSICIHSGNDEALLLALQHCGGSISRPILQLLETHLAHSANRSVYLEFMSLQIQHRALPFSDVIEFYKSLSHEEQIKQKVFLRKTFYYTNYEADVALLTDPDFFSAQRFLSLHLETIAGCADFLLAKGEKYYLKPLQRRLEKAERDFRRNTPDEIDFASFMSILSSFSSHSEIAAFYTHDLIVNESFESTQKRKSYLSSSLNGPMAGSFRRF